MGVSRLMAAAALLLNGGACDRAVRTKHTAVAGLRSQQALTTGALVIILARVRGHRLFAPQTAVRAREDRQQYDFAHVFTRAGWQETLVDSTNGLGRAHHCRTPEARRTTCTISNP